MRERNDGKRSPGRLARRATLPCALTAALLLGGLPSAAYGANGTGEGAALERLCGVTAEETAAAISQEAFPEGCDTVVVARADDPTDALSASPLAGALECPIILTDPEAPSDACLAEVERLGAKSIYVIGGKAAVSTEVESALEEAASANGAADAGAVVRVAGWTAADTSVACALLVMENGGSGEEAIVARSDDFADALSISPYAYRYKVPVLLATAGSSSLDRKLAETAKVLGEDGSWSTLETGALALLTREGVQTWVAGGPGAIAFENVENAGVTVPGGWRLYGDSAYDTSERIAREMAERGLLSASAVCVASGADRPNGVDALAGAALAGLKGGVMLLANANASADSAGTVDETTIDGFLYDNASDVSECYVLGGAYVMPEDLYQKISDMLSDPGSYEPPASSHEHDWVERYEYQLVTEQVWVSDLTWVPVWTCKVCLERFDVEESVLDHGLVHTEGFYRETRLVDLGGYEERSGYEWVDVGEKCDSCGAIK